MPSTATGGWYPNWASGRDVAPCNFANLICQRCTEGEHAAQASRDTTCLLLPDCARLHPALIPRLSRLSAERRPHSFSCKAMAAEEAAGGSAGAARRGVALAGDPGRLEPARYALCRSPMGRPRTTPFSAPKHLRRLCMSHIAQVLTETPHVQSRPSSAPRSSMCAGTPACTKYLKMLSKRWAARTLVSPGQGR
jgi:hypothetical protein